MWGVKIEEMCMQFLVYPGFTEEQISDKILSDEVIFMDEAVYQFVMFAIHHDFKKALEEVSEGLEFAPSYIFECELAAVSEDGNVVLLFKPEDQEVETIEITEEFKSKVFPELMKSIGLKSKEEPEQEEEEESSEEESSSEDMWI